MAGYVRNCEHDTCVVTIVTARVCRPLFFHQLFAVTRPHGQALVQKPLTDNTGPDAGHN